MRILIDTCVIVDYLQEREHAHDAERVITNRNNYRIITAKTVLDLSYLIQKNLHDRRQTLSLIKSIIDIVDEVVDTAAIDVVNAIDEKTSDYEDAVMVETAKRTNVDYIVTRNIKDFKHSVVPVKTPEALIGEMQFY